MTIYLPVTKFRNGDVIHDIVELESEACRLLGGYIECRGIIYGQDAYTDPCGVWHYWNKENWKADEYRFEF